MSDRRSKILLRLSVAVLAVCLAVLAYVIVLALQPEADVSVEQAVDHMRHGRLRRAVKILDQVIDREPANVNARLTRGACYLKLRQYGKSRDDFNSALQLEPGLLEAELGLAEVLWGEKRYREALAAARAAARANPGLVGPFAVAGKAHYKLFGLEAAECVRILEEEAPRSAAAAAAMAEVRAGRFESAEQCLSDWQAQDPAAASRSGFRDHLDAAKRQFGQALQSLRIGCGETDEYPATGRADTWMYLAIRLLDRGDYEEALRRINRALELSDVDEMRACLVKAKILGERSDLLIQQGQADRAGELNRGAIELLEARLRKYPGATTLRDQLAMHYIRAGMFQKADQLARHNIKYFRSIRARYAKAVVHLARREYELAIAELRDLRREMVNDPRYHYALGRAHYREGGSTASAELAMDEFRRVVELRPNFVPARVRLAKLLRRKGWYEQALEECQAILKIPGRSPKINAGICLMMSEINRNLKNFDQVLPWLSKAREAAPSDSVFMAEALQMIEEGLEDKVLQRYQKLPLEKKKDHPIYACIRGYAYLKKKDPKKAVESFRKALLLDRQFIMGYVHLANAHRFLNQTPEAIKQYQAAIKMLTDLKRPANPTLHYGLALLYFQQDRLGLAEAELNKVLELDESHVPARLRLAALELRRRNFQNAITVVKSVVNSTGETAGARFLAALIHSAWARRPDEEFRDEIEARHRTALRAVPGAVVTDAEVAAERRMHWDEAVKNYERAIELDPRFRFSYEVALIYAMQGDTDDQAYEKMASTYERALRVAPAGAKPRLYRRLAMAYLAWGVFDKAVNAAREAVRLSHTRADPSDLLRNRFTLANCLMAKADFIAARAEVRRAAEALPEFRDAYLEMIDRLERVRADADEHRNPRVAQVLHLIVARELNLGLLFSRAGPVWLPRARHIYERTLLKDPENVVVMRLLGDVYIVLSRLRVGEGRTKEAAELLAKAEGVNRRILDVRPNFALAFRNLAAIEELRTRPKAAKKTTPEERIAAQAEAVRLYRAAIQAGGKFWLPRLELAALYQRAGANDKAMKLYEEVIALNPAQVQALNDYANLCVEENKGLDKAMEYAKKAKELSPFNGAVADTLGVLLTLLRQPKEAVEQLEQARYLLPNHPTVLYHLARAYASGGQKAKALELLDRLIQNNARFPERDQAVALRDQLRP